MQIAPNTSTPLPTTGAVLPGQRLATARMAGAAPGVTTVDVTAGRVLMTGVTDVREAASKLLADTFQPVSGHTWGLVGFVRAGDAWDAVELLATTTSGPRQIAIPFGIEDFRVADGVQLDAIWNIQHFGGDTMWGTPSSIIKPA